MLILLLIKKKLGLTDILLVAAAQILIVRSFVATNVEDYIHAIGLKSFKII